MKIKFFEGKSESWEVTRARGKFYYILCNGILEFGLPMSMLIMVIFPAVKGNHSFWFTLLLILFFLFPSMLLWFMGVNSFFRKDFIRALICIVFCFVFLFFMCILNGSEINPIKDYSYIGIALGCIMGLIKSTLDWSDSEYAYQRKLKK